MKKTKQNKKNKKQKQNCSKYVHKNIEQSSLPSHRFNVISTAAQAFATRSLCNHCLPCRTGICISALLGLVFRHSED